METEVWHSPIRGTSPIDSVNRINVLMSILIIGSRKTPVSRPEIAVEIIDYMEYRGVIDGLHARQWYLLGHGFLLSVNFISNKRFY